MMNEFIIKMKKILKFSWNPNETLLAVKNKSILEAYQEHILLSAVLLTFAVGMQAYAPSEISINPSVIVWPRFILVLVVNATIFAALFSAFMHMLLFKKDRGYKSDIFKYTIVEFSVLNIPIYFLCAVAISRFIKFGDINYSAGGVDLWLGFAFALFGVGIAIWVFGGIFYYYLRCYFNKLASCVFSFGVITISVLLNPAVSLGYMGEFININEVCAERIKNQLHAKILSGDIESIKMLNKCAVMDKAKLP